MKTLLALIGIAALGVTTPAAATVLTFEDPNLTAMGNSPGSAVPVGAQLSDLYKISDGVSFTSAAGYVAVVSHDPVFTPSPPNVIGGTTSGGALSYNSPITATFFVPGGGAPGVTDFVKVLGDLIPLGAGTVTLQAFDDLGNLLGSVTDTDDQGLGFGPVLSFSHAGIHSVVLTETSGTVGFDNFQFDTPTAIPLAGVPEPASWALMLTGFGAIGLTLRRRRPTPVET